jgi:N-acetylmuramoyl-L-alanine amidase
MKRLSAVLLLLCLSLGGSAVPAQPPAQSGAESAYQKARAAYYKFRASAEQKKLRHHWQRVARIFEKVATDFPDSPRAADALFTAGRLYYELYTLSRVPEDLQRSLDLFGRLVEKHPACHLADDAQLYIATSWLEFKKDRSRARKELQFLVSAFPASDILPTAQRMLEDLSDEAQPSGQPPAEQQLPSAATAQGQETSPRPVLLELRTWSSPEYSRLVLYTSSAVRYHGEKSAAPGATPRLEIVLSDCERSDEVPVRQQVKDAIIEEIALSSQEKELRLVVSGRVDFNYRIFPLGNPERLVIDLSQAAPQPSAAEEKINEIISGSKSTREKKQALGQLREKSQPEVSLSAMAGLRIRRVVVDAGHGGRDPGAIGPGGSFEKTLALDIVLELSRLLKKEGLEVLLTRSDDRFLPLEGRTALANEKKADLFISVHLNANTNRRLRGVETFYLDLTDDRYSIKLAARENATSEKTISDLKFILADLALKSNTDDSIRLAGYVQQELVGRLKQINPQTVSHGVKPALFYVLMGARMPAVLVECSFITNPQEEKLLKQKPYRQAIAAGIHAGVKRFIQ